MNLTTNNPDKIQRNATIAQDRLAGMVYSEIAQKHNLDKSQVCRILNNDDIKDIVETGTKHLVSMVPLAIDNYRTFLSDKEHPDHYKASKDALQTTGILASHTQSTTINNILNVTAGPSHEDVQRIQELITARHDKDIIDITPDD